MTMPLIALESFRRHGWVRFFNSGENAPLERSREQRHRASMPSAQSSRTKMAAASSAAAAGPSPAERATHAAFTLESFEGAEMNIQEALSDLPHSPSNRIDRIGPSAIRRSD